MKTEERLGIEQCNALLNSGENALVLIQFPNGALPQPMIELREKQITINPKAYDDVGSTSFLALRMMFENSEDIIEASNLIVERASDS